MNCTKCNILLTKDNAYKRPDRKNGLQSYCKNCFNKYCSKRWIQRKKDSIKYLGSKCKKCNQIYHYSVFEFHHLKDKDVSWNKLRLRSWNKITYELDKCILLCANCHRLEHYS